MSANDKQVGGDHYESPIQHWDLVVANNIPYLEAVAIKYLMRHRKKNGREDLEKAIHFIEKILETQYPQEKFDDMAKRRAEFGECGPNNHDFCTLPNGRLVCNVCGYQPIITAV